jgi:hypothetical protein
MIRWHCAGWKLFWRLKSRPGRPPIPRQIQVSQVFICLAESLFICMKAIAAFDDGRNCVSARRKGVIRISGVATAICLSILGIAAGADAAARQPTNIAAQALGAALQTLARERDVQIIYRSELVVEHRTGGANGNLTFEEALTQLLDGTGLTFRYLAEKAITIVPVGDPGKSLSSQ